MNDILKAHQERHDKETYLSCYDTGQNVLSLDALHARDRALAIALLEADIKKLQERFASYESSVPHYDEDAGACHELENLIIEKQQAIEELKKNI